MPCPDDIRTNPIAGDHREIIRQARVPNAIVVSHDIVLIPERCNIWRLRVTDNAVAAKVRQAVVIFEHDYEHVIEFRDLTLVVFPARAGIPAASTTLIANPKR